MANQVEIQTAWREVLVSDSLGFQKIVEVQSVVRDVLVGDGKGVDLHPIIMQSVVREVLMTEPPARYQTVWREVLVQHDNEPLTIGRYQFGFKQQVLMRRDTTPLPATVRSAAIIPALREAVVQARPPIWPHSFQYVESLKQQTVQRRFVLRANEVRSMDRVNGYVQQTVMSRNKAYVPVSELRVSLQKQLVTQRRDFTPAPQIRTPITATKLVQQFIASRARAIIVITTYAYTESLVQQILAASGKSAPHSTISSSGLVHMTLVKRTVVPPGSDRRAASLAHHTLARRDLTPPYSGESAKSVSQQIVVRYSFTPPVSQEIVSGQAQLVVLHRDTYAPKYAMGRHTGALVEQVLTGRDPAAPMFSTISYKSLVVTYLLHRDVPGPLDVIDPSIGRHSTALVSMVVQHRDTIPPGVIAARSRYVYNLFEQPVVGDSGFPLPPPKPDMSHETDVYSVGEFVMLRDLADWSAVTRVTSSLVIESLVIGDADGWIDARVPVSDLSAAGLVESVALGDTSFPDSMQSQSDELVAAISEAVAVGDAAFPDPRIPQSVVQVEVVTEFAALGDAQWPDPTLPASEIRSPLVGAVVALGDADLTGTFGMSEILNHSVAQFAVVRDPSLIGIPLRQGPRPVVSVSMS